MIAYRVSEHAQAELGPGQFNIYDSIPGDPEYSPIWHLNYVIVPQDYVPNSIRSVDDVTASGYRVIASDTYVN